MVITVALSAARVPASAVPPGPAQLIGRRPAQRLARTELSRAMYHPHEPIASRLLTDLLRLLNHLFSAGNSVPGGWWALVALAIIAVVLIAVIMARIGPVARAHGSRDVTPAGLRTLTARDHRARAAQLTEAGDHAGASLECVRAIAAGLEERGVLSPRAGRTAAELAGEAGQALPAEAPALRAAARLFDEICYGKRAGSRAGYERLRALDARIGAASLREQRDLVGAAGSG